jgi:hypothetical protein
VRSYSKAVVTALLSAAVVTSAAAAPWSDSTKFTGTTRQKIKRNQVRLFITDGGRLFDYRVRWRARCERNGRHWSSGTVGHADPQKGYPMRGGAFVVRGNYVDPPSSVDPLAPVVTHNKFALRGRLTDDNHARGTVRIRVTVFKHHRKVNTCRAHTTWRAARVR